MDKKNISYWIIILLILSVFGGIFYQPASKTEQLYKDALSDWNSGKYQNSYYLFSKVSFFSNLKPIAIYHQGECARMLGDTSSAIKQYSFLFNNYPQSPLNLRARYLTAEQLVNSNPKKAKKYFEKIIKNYPDTDYAIASQYYLGFLTVKKHLNQKNDVIIPLSESEKNVVETRFKYYMMKAPAGRHALNAVNYWLKIDDKIPQEDYLLMAKTAYIFADYQKAKELLTKTDISQSWTTYVKTMKALNMLQQASYYTELGLDEYSSNVEIDEIIEAIDLYMEMKSNKKIALEKLISLNPAKGFDYLMTKQCEMLSGTEREACYNSLYLRYPDGKFSAEALSNIFFGKLKRHDYVSAQKIGLDHLNKFPNSNSAPMVLFWLGKISEKTQNYDEYSKYYKSLIQKYPDNYYAYRAYLRLNHKTNPLIVKEITPKSVVYPYKHSQRDIIVKLVDLDDYEVVNELCKDDDFIRSWVLYEKADYTHSVILARDAMDNLETKPDKRDLRWRLVYPIHYYREVDKYSSIAGNNSILMLSLLKEESHFDPLAQSFVGASGLMQLMPTTASEIARRHGIVNFDLFRTDDNIKLGNYYYSEIKNMLDGMDVSAVAAYNGGIGSVNKWKTSIYYGDTDEFVEQIPYEETKNYVKKVFRSYWNYSRIYTGNGE